MINLEKIYIQHNDINTIESISHLKKLSVLDISHNKLSFVDKKELPLSLTSISLEYNDIVDV